MEARRWLLILLMAVLPGLAYSAIGLASIPPLSQRVVDATGTLDRGQQAALENRLRAFEERKGSQVTVLIVASTKPETIEQFALRVAEQWKIGRAKMDDGALLVVAKNDRTLRIEVGYGLEGALNDAVAKRIIDDIIVPQFKRGDFAGGVAAGVDAMLKVIDGEPLPAAGTARRDAEPSGLRQILPVALVVSVLLGSLMRTMFGRLPGALVTGGIIGLAAWLLAGALASALVAGAIGFALTLGGAGHMGGLYLGHGGRGGGGFGGFRGGGGGFGGGGSSGRW